MRITIVKKNNYMDSIFLMKATRAALDVPGVSDAVLIMATDMNKTVLKDVGALDEKAEAAGPGDLIISLEADSERAAANVEQRLAELLEQTGGDDREEDIVYPSQNLAKQMNPCANLVFISIPGDYAGQEARNALEKGMNVFLFSDNVPLEEEIELKRYASQQGLVVMGPGCGNAVLNGVSVGMMSKVEPGPLGIVGASGSGIHEIAMLAAHAGVGISQAVGTGGRDLSLEVGGITMTQAFLYLKDDPSTQVIALVSKPPHPLTASRIFSLVEDCPKPVVVYFLGADPAEVEKSGAYGASCLEEAAEKAIRLVKGMPLPAQDYTGSMRAEMAEKVARVRADLAPSQRYLRGIYCGGTHNEEAILLARDLLSPLHANVSFGGCINLENPRHSIGHCFIDIGDEIFTKGKPHPVIDPSILGDRLLQEAMDPDVAVVLFDLLLGHGVHPDPVGSIEKSLRTAATATRGAGRTVAFVASLCGTPFDPQGYANQKSRLEALGVHVFPSNARAALFSAMLAADKG